MVKVKGEVNAAVLNGSLGETEQISGLGVLARAGGDLKDNGRLFLGGSLGYRLNDLHVVDVESADGVAALVGFSEHFLG